jgi:hypothetical protein
MFTEIFQTILLVRQKDFVETFSACLLKSATNSVNQEVLIVTDER